MNFSDFRTWFDKRFSILIQEKVDAFSLHSKSADVATIVSYITALAENGKRFRPFLIHTASGFDERDSEKHFLLLTSIELLHVFALIHDDIMDDADTRHAVVCAHRKFSQEYTPKIAEGIALLLGDIVFAWAYECLLAYTKEFPNFSDRIIAEFTKLVSEVTHGQLLDILSPAQSPRDKDALVEKIVLKTARYSFVQPMRIGFVLSGDYDDDQIFAERFGTALGIAFQIQDDLLDITSSDQTGKTCFGDIQSGQQTFLSWYMYHKATAEQQKEFNTFFGRKSEFSAKEQSRLLQILDESGARMYTQQESEQYFVEAQKVLDMATSPTQEKWQEILDLVKKRTK